MTESAAKAVVLAAYPGAYAAFLGTRVNGDRRGFIIRVPAGRYPYEPIGERCDEEAAAWASAARRLTKKG